VKEARFALTLQAWIRQNAHVEAVIWCLREPMQVAQSIKRRNKTIIWHGLRLWHRHNQELLHTLESNPIPVLYVLYSNLFVPDSATREIHRAFKLFGLDASPDAVKELCDKIVDPAKSHSMKTNLDYAPHIQKLWQQLLQRHAGQQPGSCREKTRQCST
jgi:hypothetical protein